MWFGWLFTEVCSMVVCRYCAIDAAKIPGVNSRRHFVFSALLWDAGRGYCLVVF
jgi:hypothetical protein